MQILGQLWVSFGNALVSAGVDLFCTCWSWAWCCHLNGGYPPWHCGCHCCCCCCCGGLVSCSPVWIPGSLPHFHFLPPWNGFLPWSWFTPALFPLLLEMCLAVAQSLSNFLSLCCISAVVRFSPSGMIFDIKIWSERPNREISLSRMLWVSVGYWHNYNWFCIAVTNWSQLRLACLSFLSKS